VSNQPRPFAFRFCYFDQPQAPWRATVEEALADALDARSATLVDGDPNRVCLTFPAFVWKSYRAIPVEPRGTARKKGPTSAPPRSGIERIIARREARNSASF
jgi:hypothetical protein